MQNSRRFEVPKSPERKDELVDVGPKDDETLFPASVLSAFCCTAINSLLCLIKGAIHALLWYVCAT